LAVALGSVSVLAYRSIEKILGKEQEAQRQLLRTQYRDRIRSESNKLDRLLRMQARALGQHAQFQFGRSDLSLLPLSLLSAGLDPNGFLLAPIWLSERNRNPRTDYLRGLFMAQIRFKEEDLPRLGDVQLNEYFQINSETGAVWRSHSMGDRSFPFSPAIISNTQLLDWHMDDTEIEPGISVRRVTLKVAVARVTFQTRNRGGIASPRSESADRAAAGRNGQPAQRPPRSEPFERPVIFIQCAAETIERDSAIAALREELEEKLQDLDQDSKYTLSDLRNWTWVIGLATFAALCAGCLWLVRTGLSPLRRLSAAVGRVSPKDFCLTMENKDLPTELRPIVDRLTRTLELLRSAFEREKHAAADISHELRTPLAALLTTLEVGLRKPRSPDEYRELLGDCHAIGGRMSELVERLLTLARLDAGADGLRPMTVDAGSLAEECADLVRPLAQARELSLEVCERGPAPLCTDPDKLREILTNLLHNAIEYNRAHGRVELHVGKENGHVELEVRDTGIGISPDQCEHIFERFYRADESRHTNGGLHAGLGLAIVKGYVDLLGGTIRVESAKDEGTTFRVAIPSLTINHS
jgi:signal transduction histidine kinase